MRKSTIDLIFEIISKGVKSGIGQLYTEDEFYENTTITFGNKTHINFGSYSYLGLELDTRLKDAACEAIQKYGIQYPSSRTYVSSTLYKELEFLFTQMFNAPIVLATSTTIAHVATMPIVVNEKDIIIMDQQVHSSVQFMVTHLQLYGVPFQIVRHNNMEQLESKIKELSQKYNKVWYMLDGVYSMYGDLAPMKELEHLLNKYPKFHIYVDDAHGMSWCGKNGVGYALSEIPLHEKMILVTSLNKAFAAGGALVIMKNEELSNRVKTCGGPFIFAGQHQMSALGASIACAKIHLSDQIIELQNELALKVAHCQNELESYGLPIISNPKSPIFFIGVGLPRVGYNLVKKMIDSGQYVNLAIFPAVAETRTGVRFTITCAHTLEQISKMAQLLSSHFKEALLEEERTLQDIHHAFRRVIDLKTLKQSVPQIEKEKKFILQCETSITKIPEAEWNSYFGQEVSMNWKLLKSIEEVFSKTKNAPDNWKFRYYILKDRNQKILLATYFTLCMAKDDAIAPTSVSMKIEQLREADPNYLCSKTMMMGSPLSIGNHIYIDYNSPIWKKGVMYFLDHLWKDQRMVKANSLNLRDFNESHSELTQFFMDQGFIKVSTLQNHSIQNLVNFKNTSEYLNQLNSKQRYFVKKRSIPFEKHFSVKIIKEKTTPDVVNRLYELYKNIHDKSYELNLFPYPKALFKKAVEDESWDVLTLQLNNGKIIATAISTMTKGQYTFLIAGLDYDFLERYDLYSQLLFQIIKRANELGYKHIELGFTTGQNKRKFGARSTDNHMFIQFMDNYNASIIASMSNSILSEKLPSKKKRG